ncbi:MAG: Fic/DOC family protein [Sporichthyaceae bacterium]
MPGRFDSWESYFYPETINPVTGNGTLCNRFDERDPDVLRMLEYGSTAQRGRQLIAGEIDVARTFDAAHVCAIHRHLFADVYEWAGEYRTVDMVKGGPRGFAEVGSGEIDRYLDDVHNRVLGTDWGRLDRDGFAYCVAEVFVYVNQAHPFREGNGRTSKVFWSTSRSARRSPSTTTGCHPRSGIRPPDSVARTGSATNRSPIPSYR